MPRTTYRRIASLTAGKTAIEKHTDQSFAHKLHAAMARNRMSASDLARAIWGSTVTNTGHNAARNRDRISAYLSGRSTPEQANLEALAKALNTTAEELAPDLAASAIDRANPELAMTMIAGRPDLVHLKVDKLVSLEVASQVVALMSAAERAKAVGAMIRNTQEGATQIGGTKHPQQTVS
jgi:transcriptional regulator with XRE-family HTH domain